MTLLTVAGMTCDSCALHVKQALEKVRGVLSADVSYPKGTAQLSTATGLSPEPLIAAVAALGYRASLADTAATAPRSGLLDKALGWLGGGDKAGAGAGALHIAVIGSGGAAMAAALKAAERGARA